MTRIRKVDWDVLEREYIYDADTPAISYQGLADRHGLAKNTVAEKGIKGHWHERREAFRHSLGIKVTEAMGEEWARFETAAREKVLAISMQVLERFEKQLQSDPDYKISARDALGWAGALKTLSAEQVSARIVEEGRIIDPDEERHLDPDEYRNALAVIRQLEAGQPVDAGDLEATGTEGPRED